MRIAEAPLAQLKDLLRGEGLSLNLGLVRARVRADVAHLAEAVQRVYGAFPLDPAEGFCDLTVTLLPAGGVLRWARPQIQFFLEGETPFEPFAADTHLPMLEWGLNWGIAQRFNDRLLLHAGVVEKNGAAIILPAIPGSGKSTLTAALVQRGYRLLSDEFGPADGEGNLFPAVRPIALKNDSIEVIRRFAADAIIGPVFPNTRKGAVAHVAPDARAVAAIHVPAPARLIVFPNYVARTSTVLEEIPKARAFARLSVNAFNYELRGPEGFEAVQNLIDRCGCYALTYSEMDEAIAILDGLLEDGAGPSSNLSGGEARPH